MQGIHDEMPLFLAVNFCCLLEYSVLAQAPVLDIYIPFDNTSGELKLIPSTSLTFSDEYTLAGPPGSEVAQLI